MKAISPPIVLYFIFLSPVLFSVYIKNYGILTLLTNILYFSEHLNNTKALLEGGIVKWTEYEEQYKEALDWLSKTEKLVQSFNKLQNNLEQKKVVLEQFQVSFKYSRWF